jgi:hypothetical protein
MCQQRGVPFIWRRGGGGYPSRPERGGLPPHPYGGEGGEVFELASIRALWWGVLHAIGMFGVDTLTEEEKIEGAEKRAWFSVGEVTMAAILAGTIAVPAGFWFAAITALPLAVIGGAVIFLPLFVFLPRLIQYAMKADTDAVLDAFGKNEQVKKVFWTFFIATAGLVLAQVVDPGAAEKIVGMIAGIVP